MADNYADVTDALANGRGRGPDAREFDPSADHLASDMIALQPRRVVRLGENRYPVPLDEYRQIVEDAEAADPAPLAAGDAAADQAADVDVGDGVEELPESGAQPGALAPASCGAFASLTQGRWRPPDCTVATGRQHVLAAVNTEIACYTKNGGVLFQLDLHQFFGPVLPSGARIFDPVMAYDHYEHRWVVVVAAVTDSPRRSWLLVATSQTEDPTGLWWQWALDASLNGSQRTENWFDFPMLGFDAQCIYISGNMFAGNTFQYVKMRVLHKAQLYAGTALTWMDWWNFQDEGGSMAFTIQPCKHFRGASGNPPAYMVNGRWSVGNSLTTWRLANPAHLWIGGSPTWSRATVATMDYAIGPDASQPDTSTGIDTGDNRLLCAIYQYTGSERRIWTAHTVKHTWPDEGSARTVVGWYALDPDSSTVAQQRKYGAPGQYYFYPAIQTDISGNAFVVFGRSSQKIYGQLRYTGRKVGAPLGDLENSSLIKSGESAYTEGRWGDYFSCARDAADPSRVWMYGEYAESGNQWGTWINCAEYP